MSKLLACIPLLCVSLGSALPEGFKQTLLKDMLDAVSCLPAPDGRVFLMEKKGIIHVFDRDGKMLPEPLLNYEANTNSTFEKGMEQMMLHPDFASNGFLYVQYTNKREFAGRGRNQVSRFKVTGNKADPSSETMIFSLGDAGTNYHHGGGMHVGPDGKLYVASGNRNNGGAGGGSSDKNSVLGKILRINLDGTIPDDNPFYAANTGDARAVWAYGLRNPYSIDFDASGKLYANDVNDDKAGDELNLIEKGGFYGYNIGGGKDPLYTGGGVPDYVEKAMVGAEFYQGTQFPEKWRGRMFFGGIGRGDRTVQTFDPAAAGAARFEVFTRLGGTGSSEECPIDYKVDPVGSLYIVTRCETVGWNNGKLIKVTFGDPPPWPATSALRRESLLRTSLRWTRRRGALDVELLRGGPQSVEIRSVGGDLVAAAASGSAGAVRLATGEARGIHFMIWKSGRDHLAVKLAL